MVGRVRPKPPARDERLRPQLAFAAAVRVSPRYSHRRHRSRVGIYDGGTVINLYVGNLPFSTTSDDLAALFGKVGAVTSAQVITDRETGRSRGFGFVEMGDDDARKAIDELTGANMGGRSITVNEARPRAPRENRGGDRGGPRRDDRRY